MNQGLMYAPLPNLDIIIIKPLNFHFVTGWGSLDELHTWRKRHSFHKLAVPIISQTDLLLLSIFWSTGGAMFYILFLGWCGQFCRVWSRLWHFVHQFSTLIACPVKHWAYMHTRINSHPSSACCLFPEVLIVHNPWGPFVLLNCYPNTHTHTQTNNHNNNNSKV